MNNVRKVDPEVEKLFKLTKKIKPKYNLTAEEMDDLNDKLFSRL